MKAKDVETSSQIAHDSNLLINENKELKLKVENLNKILTNFTNGKKILDNLLGSQRCVFDKAGIRYNLKVKEKCCDFLKCTQVQVSQVVIKSR
jgi:hypothetical protein